MLGVSPKRFDAISTAAEETKNPQRKMPLGILGGLAICTLIYVIIGIVATGLVPYQQLKAADPLARALEVAGLPTARWIVAFGAVENLDDDTLDEVLLLDLVAPVRLARTAIGVLPEGGFLVQVSAVVAEKAMPGMAAYSAAKAGIAVAFGTAIAGLSRGSQTLDAWAEGALTRRGVRRPRLWMGVVAAGASLAMSAADRRRTRRDEASSTR